MSPVKEHGGQLPEETSDLNQMMMAEWGSIENFMNYFNAHTATL